MRALETTGTFTLPDTRVAVAGDWHGNFDWIGRAIPAAARSGAETLLHAGDLGFWPGHTDALLASVDGWVKKTQQSRTRRPGLKRILVTPGNHEDWDDLDALFTDYPGEAVRVSEAVWVLPRGFRFAIGGRSCLSFGGAASIDFESRVDGHSWWPAEMPTAEDVTRAVAAGPVDIVLTHDAGRLVTPAVQRILDRPPSWTRIAHAYADASRDVIARLVDGVRPGLHVHGHFHVADFGVADREGQRPLQVLSLGADGDPGNIWALKLTGKHVDVLPPITRIIR